VKRGVTWTSAQQPTFWDTPMCRDAMLGVAGRNFIKKYEHYSSLTQALDKLALCVYVDFCGIRIEVSATTR